MIAKAKAKGTAPCTLKLKTSIHVRTARGEESLTSNLLVHSQSAYIHMHVHIDSRMAIDCRYVYRYTSVVCRSCAVYSLQSTCTAACSLHLRLQYAVAACTQYTHSVTDSVSYEHILHTHVQRATRKVQCAVCGLLSVVALRRGYVYSV